MSVLGGINACSSIAETAKLQGCSILAVLEVLLTDHPEKDPFPEEERASSGGELSGRPRNDSEKPA